MKTFLVEKESGNQKIYTTTLVKPEQMSVFNNGLSMKIIRELAKQPQCAMDVSRKLKEHEQNIYYHLKRMRDAGLIRLVSEENRLGMTAKIYELVSPVIAAKLHDEGYTVNKSGVSFTDPEITKLLDPFIKNGKLNAKIIIGDPYPHGKFDTGGMDSCYTADLTMFLGNILKEIPKPCLKLDILTNEDEMEDSNLIIVGGPKYNTVSYKINSKMPIFFDEDEDWKIVSKISGKTYSDDLGGVIIRARSPFNRKKEIIWLAGRRTRATLTAVIAFTSHIDDLMKGNVNNPKITAKIAHGIDKNGDGIIDDIEFLE